MRNLFRTALGLREDHFGEIYTPPDLLHFIGYNAYLEKRHFLLNIIIQEAFDCATVETPQALDYAKVCTSLENLLEGNSIDTRQQG